MQNLIKRSSGESLGHMWPAARAYEKDVYEKHMAAVYAGYPALKEHLEKHHKQKCQRSSFNSEIKCDYVTNNVAEVFNNWIKDIKVLPIVDLVDKIREMIMVLFHKRRRIGERLHGRILPAVLQILRAKNWRVGTPVCYQR
jgi:transposase-like protein